MNKQIRNTKIINIGNTCAFDTLVFWINLIPTEKAVKILDLMDDDLRTLIIRLTEQLYMSSSNNYNLQERLIQINNIVKNKYNVRPESYLSIDEMIFENEKLTELLLNETFDNFKDDNNISIQIVHVNGNHYLIKIIINDIENNIINEIYINDIEGYNLNYIDFNSEKIVLVCNLKLDYLDKLYTKIENMCE